jgi:hypothetical protein
MENKSQKDHSMSSSAIYQIIVKGKLDTHWADWFNGTFISITYDTQDSSRTILTLQIRDQSELLGILNYLHNLNLSLLQVKLK